MTNSSTKSRFITEKMKLKNVKYVHVKSQDLPSFILSDKQETLFSIKDENEKQDTAMRKKKEKTSFLWTNYNTFIKALNLLFTNLWNTKTTLDANLLKEVMIIKKKA